MLERAQEAVDRRRLVIGLCAAVAVALIAAIPGILTSADNARNVRTTEFAQVTPTTGVPVVNALPGEPLAPAPTPPPTTTTTPPALVLGTVITRPPTRSPNRQAPKQAAPTATSAPKASPPTSACRNSYDQACGPFRWDPDPGPNQPASGQVTPSSQTVRVGDTVTFRLTASDPDAAPLSVCRADFGQGEQGFVCDPRPKMDPNFCKAQYGPWTPPAKQPGNLDTVEQHTYAQPGTYNVTFTINSAQEQCNNPYASTTDLQATVVVTP